VAICAQTGVSAQGGGAANFYLMHENRVEQAKQMLKIWLQLTAATDPNPSRRRAAATARKLTRTGREAPITSAAHSKD